MQITLYSDLHLEFGVDFKPIDTDVLILAGDICTFKNFKPLGRLLEDFKKPVLYIAGNHEYYTKEPMELGRKKLKAFLSDYPNVTFLENESITIGDVNFFGGTMWTEFKDPLARQKAYRCMNDYRLIKHGNKLLVPEDTTEFHKEYVKKLIEWLETTEGKKVVISHHAPVSNPNSEHYDSELQPAYVSLDMIPIILKYKPNLWVWGHTHETYDDIMGVTRLVANCRGYPLRNGGSECRDFKSDLRIEI